MKKRLLSLLLCLCVTLPMLPVYITATAAVLYGDADDDRDVDLQDILLMEKHIAGEQVVLNETNADVNSDGAIDREDVRLIRDYLAGNLAGLTPDLCTVTFDTGEGSAVAPIAVGRGYSIRKEIPSPAREGYLFTGWIKSGGSRFYQEDPVTGDMTLTAAYEAVNAREGLSVHSFALTGQSPGVSFRVTGDYASAAEVRANLDVVSKDGSDPVAIEVLDDGDGVYTVKAKDGFTPGASYELTLRGGLRFADKSEMFRTAAFIIAKDESDRLYYNESLVFIRDTDDMSYTVDGITTDMLELNLFSSDGGDADVSGTFTMPGGLQKAGDYLCIYETADPRNRDYTQNDYADDRVAYIRVTAVSGSVFSFESLDKDDARQVLRMPDSVPFRVAALPPAGTGTAGKNDYDAAARTALGFTEAPKYRTGDFLIFYTVDFAAADNNTPARYAQVTGTNGDTVHYQTVEKSYIESYMGMFVSTDVDGGEVLAGVDQKAFLDNVREQAEKSGFAAEAAEHMVQSALETDSLQKALLKNGLTRKEISGLKGNQAMAAAGGGGDKRVQFKVEKTSIKPSLSKGTRFSGGIMLRLDMIVQLSVDMKISETETSSLKIDLSAGFEQELAAGVNVNVEDEWTWYAFIPVLKELSCYANVDIRSYSSVSVGANIYTVASEQQKKEWEAITSATDDVKVQEALREINKLGVLVRKHADDIEKAEEYAKKLAELRNSLPKVLVGGKSYTVEEVESNLGKTDVSSEFGDILSAKTEDQNKVGLEKLMNKYVEMLNRETDWVKLYDQTLFEQEYHIKIIAVKFSVNFIVQANVNISIGADVEYQTGKRYNFWVRIMARTSGSSEMDLLDERFGFQFYVMGAIGLKAGVKAEIAVGIISTKIASIGANVEFGPYLRIYGYFFYIYTRQRPANTAVWNEKEEMLGAMYVEFGLYLTVKFKAQALDETFVYEPTLYDGEFPLLTAGVRKNVYDFAYKPSKDDVLRVADSDADSSNGITMAPPQSYRMMKTIDLRTGSRTQEGYDPGRFGYTLSNRHFAIDQNDVISVTPPAGTRYMECSLTLTWKSDKLAFSKYDLAVTVPLVWTNMSDLELKERFTASVAVGNQTDGYDIVWSGRYSRIQPVNLPSQDEILALIGYDGYNAGGINLKYSAVGGYRAGTPGGQAITADTVYYFEITPREYTVNVRGVQKTDGTAETRVYRATYGSAFDLSGLRNTGANNPAARKYTAFLNLTDHSGGAFDPNTAVNMSFAEKYGVSADLDANYADEALTATYLFRGVGAPEVSVKFKRGEIPYFEGMSAYVEQYGGAGAEVTGISPAAGGRVEHSIQYIVECRVETPKPKYTLDFDTNGGNAVKSQEYPKDALIFRPTDPVRTGYAFTGWYKDAAFTQAFSFDTPMPGGNMTLYAKWKANAYTVTLLSGSTTVGTKTVDYDSPYGDLAAPDKQSDFKFTGWYTQAAGGVKIEPSTVFKSTEDVTLYARWAEKEVIDTGKIPGPRQTYTYDETAKAFSVQPAAPYTGMTGFAVTYKSQAAGSEWTDEVPVNAGMYDVKINRPWDDDYKTMAEIFVEGAVKIDKASLALAGRGAVTAGEVVRVHMPDGLKGDGAVTYRLQIPGGGAVYTSATGFFTRMPQGTYEYRVAVAEGTNYKAASSDVKTVAVSGHRQGSYSVDFKIKTADVANAGTDSNVRGGIYYHTNAHSTLTLMDIEEYDDFERNKEDTYTVINDIEPWEVYGHIITKDDAGSAAGWCMERLEVIARYGTRSFSYIDPAYLQWFEGESSQYFTKPLAFKRGITGTDNFSAGGGSIDLSGLPENYSYAYSGKIRDQFYPDGYGCMEYAWAPEFNVSSGNGAYDRFIRYTGLTSFEIDTAGLAAYIRKNGGGNFKYTVSLAFDDRTVKNTRIFTKEIAVQVPVEWEPAAPAAMIKVARTVSLGAAGGTGGVSLVISAGKINALKGQTVEVPVRLAGDAPLWGVLASVNYNRNVLELSGHTAGNVFREDLFTLQQNLAAAPYKFLAARDSPDDSAVDGTLLTLRFKVKDDVKDQPCAIDLRVIQAVNARGEILETEHQDGAVVVDSGPPVISGIENGKTYYGAQTVTVRDENLLKVTVNGAEVALTNGRFILYPAEGAQTVTAADMAGYETSATVTVLDQSKAPKTGDPLNVFFWLFAALVSGGILTTAAVIGKKRKQ